MKLSSPARYTVDSMIHIHHCSRKPHSRAKEIVEWGWDDDLFLEEGGWEGMGDSLIWNSAK